MERWKRKERIEENNQEKKEENFRREIKKWITFYINQPWQILFPQWLPSWFWLEQYHMGFHAWDLGTRNSQDEQLVHLYLSPWTSNCYYRRSIWDPSETDMPDRRPWHAYSETDISDQRPIWDRHTCPIKDHHACGEPSETDMPAKSNRYSNTFI